MAAASSSEELTLHLNDLTIVLQGKVEQLEP